MKKVKGGGLFFGGGGRIAGGWIRRRSGCRWRKKERGGSVVTRKSIVTGEVTGGTEGAETLAGGVGAAVADGGEALDRDEGRDAGGEAILKVGLEQTERLISGDEVAPILVDDERGIAAYVGQEAVGGAKGNALHFNLASGDLGIGRSHFLEADGQLKGTDTFEVDCLAARQVAVEIGTDNFDGGYHVDVIE